MANIQMQARSSVDGALYTWISSAPDFAGAGFPGPGTALDVAVSMRPPGSGAGGGLVVSGSPSPGDSVKWNGTGAVWGGAAYDITAFAAVTPLVEPGATVTNPSFTSAQNKASTSLQLTNNKTAENKNVLATPTAFASSAGSQVLATHGSSWSFTLTGTDSISPDSAVAAITARQKNFAGKPAVGNTSPATLAAGATYSAFASSGAMTFTITDDGTHEIQFMRRAAYGVTPAFVKDAATGFGVSYTLVGTFSYTNSQGFTENFCLFKLDVPVNGTVTIDVGA